jgi:benzoate-CoA ligase family protein
MTATKDPFNLRDYLLSEEKLRAIGTRKALEFRGLLITYDNLREVVYTCARQLHSLGVKEGDRVAILLYDSPEFVAYFLATVSLRAICVPINTFLTAEEIRFILKDSGSTVLVLESGLAGGNESPGSDNDAVELIIDKNSLGTSSEPFYTLRSSYLRHSTHDETNLSVLTSQVDWFKAAPPSPSFSSIFEDTCPSSFRETPAFILYTSGSTGTPKGALHTHGNVEATVKSFGGEILNLQPTDKIFSASRLFFAYGLGNSLSFPLAAGATVILEAERPTPQVIAKIFQEQRPTVFFGVPAVYRALLDFHRGGASLDTSSLRLCVSAGEALPATIFEEWRSTFGLHLLDGIGSTEMLHMFICNREGAAKAGSSGQVVSGYEAEILDGEGKQVPMGAQGNLWIKGSSAMAGYWGREDLTAEVVRDGWIRTGDIYRQDEDGYYYHIGRSDDCFKVKGLGVSPVEIESVLLSHPEVSEAAVVASSDESGLATAKAYLVIRKGSESLKKEIYEFARARLALYKTPTLFEFVKALPRTSTGKIQRFRLRHK